ncbi:MAG TPA: tRNA pseudouridine(38-40) synthase TruA [Bacillota bacterium]|nr:tRNA pseudouridine(38-40) synthase TruA [Bacillota bacterium]HOA16166.1 tRNA pseudouridine(38-40) synthase TruA [Bacillota bacterium]HOG53398.1 tRNA pseudouridine(38-40) synthase TruA [Bacillota bacterium]
MSNIYLKVQYDGRYYFGFQRQVGFLTVQEVLEKAVLELTGEESPVTGSGRTDAGVHALGQVVNFRTSSSIPPDRWMFAINTKLPKDIRAVSSGLVPDGFSSRFDAVSKTYRYLILPGSDMDALMGGYAWVMRGEPSVERMRQAACVLRGTHDFSAFRSAGSSETGPVRNLWGLEVEEGRIEHLGCRYISITASADGFLYKMVRNITGALVEAAAMGENAADYVADLLERRDRALAPPPAPASGLYLVKVTYPEIYNI